MDKLSERSWRESKKLAEAAKLFAAGKLRIPGDDEAAPQAKIEEGLAAFGLCLETPEINLEDTFVLWPDCLETFQFWIKIQTQWIRDLKGNIQGLNYPAVDVVMNWEQIPLHHRQDLSNDIRAMEIAVINDTRK